MELCLVCGRNCHTVYAGKTRRTSFGLLGSRRHDDITRSADPQIHVSDYVTAGWEDYGNMGRFGRKEASWDVFWRILSGQKKSLTGVLPFHSFGSPQFMT